MVQQAADKKAAEAEVVATQKLAEEKPKAEGRLRTSREQARAIIEKVDQATSQTDFFSAGFLGKKLSDIPGTDAFDLVKQVDTIKANLGFQALQEMRNNSPTGGALGQVAVQELNMLQSTVSSLDTGQGIEQLKENLSAVRVHMENWRNAVEAAHKAKFGELPSRDDGSDAPATPEGSTATHPQTGQKIIFRNGQWQPVNQ